MIIDQLPLLLGDVLLTDEFPIERGTTTYKATLSQIFGSVFAAIEPNFAGAYDSTATYAVGDYVVYEHTLYVCNTAIPTAEQWTAAHWTQVDIGTVLQSKQDKITASGILKGNGSGGVSAAAAGTDYQTPFETTTLTIETSEWTNNSVSKTVSGMTATALVFVEFSDTTTDYTVAQSTNTLTFTASAAPSSQITVKVGFFV